MNLRKKRLVLTRLGSGVIAGTLGLPSFRNYFTLDTRPNAAGVTGAMLGLSYAGG